MNSWRSKLSATLVALAMFSVLAAPVDAAKSKHQRKHGKHVAANHHAPKRHKPPKHV